MDENNRTARRDGESDEAYRARIAELQAGLARILPADAPLADAPQQQADADARVASKPDLATRIAQGADFGLAPLKADLRDLLPTIYPTGDAVATEFSAAQTFSARIAAAKFDHREQGHDETMKLLDEMYAAIERLEAERG
jgi:hypothetical protein